MDWGSPPCSPQMPHSRSGFVAAAFFHRHVDQLPHAVPIQGGKGIGRQDAGFHVFDEKAGFGVVTGDAEGGLGQVVGAEGKEFGVPAIWSAVRAARGSSIMVPNL
jgi:hypothetical protein